MSYMSTMIERLNQPVPNRDDRPTMVEITYRCYVQDLDPGDKPVDRHGQRVAQVGERVKMPKHQADNVVQSGRGRFV